MMTADPVQHGGIANPTGANANGVPAGFVNNNGQAPGVAATSPVAATATAGAPAAGGPPQFQLAPAYSNVNFDPASFMSSLNTYEQPQFQQQDAALQSALANAGIVGGSTAGAEAELGEQQQQTEQGLAQSTLLQLLGESGQQSEFNAGGYNTNEDLAAQLQNSQYLQAMGIQ